MCSRLHHLNVLACEYIYKINELGSDLFIVQKGRVEVVRTATEQGAKADKKTDKDKDPSQKPLFTITIGTYFGENAVVHQEVRSACRPQPKLTSDTFLWCYLRHSYTPSTSPTHVPGLRSR